MAPAEASATYRRGLDEVSRYLEEMEAPRPMIDAMVATSSSEIQWVDSQRDGIQQPPSIAEWSDASCGPFTKEEESTLLDLMGKRPRLSSNEAMLYNMLSNKENARASCEGALYSSHRDQLAAPGLFDDISPETDRSRVDQLSHP